MDYLIEPIKQLIINYGSLSTFLVGILEEVLFIIPSSFIFLAVGFLIIDPSLGLGEALLAVLWKISFWGALGVTIGSFFIYGIFYWGGKKIADRYGKYLGLSWLEIEGIQKKFTRGWADELIIFLLRAMPIWSITVVSAFCGLMRISWKKFGIYTFLGAAVRLLLLGMLGWSFGGAYEQLASQLDLLEKVSTLLLVLMIVGGLWWGVKKIR